MCGRRVRSPHGCRAVLVIFACVAAGLLVPKRDLAGVTPQPSSQVGSVQACVRIHGTLANVEPRRSRRTWESARRRCCVRTGLLRGNTHAAALPHWSCTRLVTASVKPLGINQQQSRLLGESPV